MLSTVSPTPESLCLRHLPAPRYRNMEASRAEVELVIFSAIDDLLIKMGISRGAINILVVRVIGVFCRGKLTRMSMMVKFSLSMVVREHLSGNRCCVLNSAPTGNCSLH